tara:strand:- start:225 stop:452 length:228 start_codon:yes stop_codon:yes gene_type:complete
MLRFAASIVSGLLLSHHNQWLGVIPLFAFVLDRWMIWEANKYRTLEEISTFDKFTMILPAGFIWTSLILALAYKT